MTLTQQISLIVTCESDIKENKSPIPGRIVISQKTVLFDVM
ncbi:hypothetical protein APHWI1_0521 [Anaplasma phagocytophilum str. ApWI1]|uniref:Uncharacterized protein n=1 Tax=Anaplasma phagocytophilum str. ApWI1 TaxID=1359155 RepID=A0A0F3PWY4_ANAPH|nr:hypothetical protein APHHGE2_1318 [Anaplasma phagocytophilum str. HGE2]KJV84880.1 hypothetical protein APHWI1_0521 [Anaplasma phagocytophilum str. ApWI1]KJV98344.1 hypothetical protein OTSANNIE_1290 [Anaplasma phagocytophilum str. Annie]KJZ98948.1 hypothetical protein APHCR_0503 [Anaplasma phagocytophilum str. CR1007]